ncbi:EpsG family protein [Symbiopectobacterium purcellii]|uniref:EpsG family protein n=2 Tax=Symbiopectobacterium purcellii TaxID=2871826 RepID=A0ABX9ARF1_9ENTR|nr:EpsG family protein [Symbiopectobacterium purcellii]
MMLLLSVYYKEASGFFFRWAVFVTMVFSGFRYDAGNDFFTYQDMIKGTFPYDKLEPISKALIEISSYFGESWVFFLITSIIYIYSVYYFCKELSDRPQFSFFLFCVLPLSFLTSFGYVRQFLAIGFFCIALVHFLYGRKLKFWLFFVLSLMCHYSAIFFLPIFLLYGFLSKRVYPLVVYLIFIGVAFASSGYVLLASKYVGVYGAYIDGERFIDSGRKIGYVVIALFFYFYIFSLKERKKLNVFLLNVYFVFSCAYALLMPFGEYIVRIIYFLFPSAYILFSSTLVSNVKLRLVQSIGVICFGIALYFATLYFATTNGVRDFLTNYSISLFV